MITSNPKPPYERGAFVQLNINVDGGRYNTSLQLQVGVMYALEGVEGLVVLQQPWRR